MKATFNKKTGANVNDSYDSKTCVEAYCYRENANLETMMILVEEGKADLSNSFPLHHLLANLVIPEWFSGKNKKNVKIDLLEYFLSKGKEVNVKDRKGFTPMHYFKVAYLNANYSRRLNKEAIDELIEFLLERGASLESVSLEQLYLDAHKSRHKKLCIILIMFASSQLLKETNCEPYIKKGVFWTREMHPLFPSFFKREVLLLLLYLQRLHLITKQKMPKPVQEIIIQYIPLR